jgi:hypothetical protein
MAYISGIDTASPGSTAAAGQGDDEIRSLKIDVKASFPNVNSAVNANPAELNTLTGAGMTQAKMAVLADYTGSAAELNRLDGLTTSTTRLNYSSTLTGNVQTQINTLSTNTTNSLNNKANLSGSTSQRFDVQAPNANDQAIRRDTYATSSTGGTLKARLSGTDLFLRNDGTNA